MIMIMTHIVMNIVIVIMTMTMMTIIRLHFVPQRDNWVSMEADAAPHNVRPHMHLTLCHGYHHHQHFFHICVRHHHDAAPHNVKPHMHLAQLSWSFSSSPPTLSYG